MTRESAESVGTAKLSGVYGLMLVGTVLAFFAVRYFGEGLTAPVGEQAGSAKTVAARGTNDALFHVLFALAAVVVSGRIVGSLFKKIGQPPVIGEVVAGIMLGPSLLGRVAPDAYAWLLPPSVAPHLGILSQIGVILYMFVVGLELDWEQLRKRGHATIAISHASIVVPFLLGALLALGLYPVLSSDDVGFTPFALFLGAAMSVTAFPVLARILTDRKLSWTPLGIVALTCAAADDATAWCLLAFVVGVAQAQVGGALAVVGMTIAYISVMLGVVRPALQRYGQKFFESEANQGTLAIVLCGVLGSALLTELIGIHAVFGAFALGAVIPHDSRLAHDLTRKLEDFVAVFLLPAFFAFTGMRTQIGLVAGLENWLWCGLIIVVATTGKFSGTVAAARFTGMGWREASSLGVLMNTRGLMELIVLNIGLDMKVISPTLFAMMVLMALATTIATAPLLKLLWPEAQREAERALDEKHLAQTVAPSAG